MVEIKISKDSTSSSITFMNELNKRIVLCGMILFWQPVLTDELGVVAFTSQPKP